MEKGEKYIIRCQILTPDIEYDEYSDVLYILFQKDVKVYDRRPCSVELIWAFDEENMPIGVTLCFASELLRDKLCTYLDKYFQNIGKLKEIVARELNVEPKELEKEIACCMPVDESVRHKIGDMVRKDLKTISCQECILMEINIAGRKLHSWCLPFANFYLELTYDADLCEKCEKSQERGKNYEDKLPCIAVIPRGLRYILHYDRLEKAHLFEQISTLGTYLESLYRLPEELAIRGELPIEVTRRELIELIKLLEEQSTELSLKYFETLVKTRVVRGYLSPHIARNLMELSAKLQQLGDKDPSIMRDIASLLWYTQLYVIRKLRE